MADGDAKFVLEGGRLAVQGQLGPEGEKAYSEALYRLLNSGEKELEVDLTGLHLMSSAYVGSTCLFVLVAKQKHMNVTVTAKGKLADILRAAGLDKLTELRVGEP